MDRLINERTTSLGRPAALDRSAVIFGRAIPLDVSIGLDDLSQASRVDRSLEKLDGVIEPVLAHNSKLYPGISRYSDHGASGAQLRCHRLLHQNMLLCFSAEAEGLEAKIGKGADINIVHPRVPAHLLKRCHKLRSSVLRELPAIHRVGVRT